MLWCNKNGKRAAGPGRNNGSRAMFEPNRPKSGLAGTIELLTLIYFATVRTIRKSHGNAVIGLAMSLFQTLIFVAAFYVMFSVLGMRGTAVRGDFLLYLLSGIFLYLTHIKAVGSVSGAEGPTSPMMQHAPMNTFISIAAAALSSLYIQMLALIVVLGVYHAGFTPVTIYKPAEAMGMMMMAWFSGVAIGLVFLAMKPWFPGLSGVISTVYTRANMIASGKMFLANTMGSTMVAFFDWNPLFHIIDQARGFTFINYNPHFSNTTYPIILSVVLCLLGLMGEAYTRKHASLSWYARR